MAGASHLRLLDFDGSLPVQPALRERLDDGRASAVDLRGLGSALRLWSGGRAWSRLEAAVDRADEAERREGRGRPFLTLVGSGDFHHVSAALIRRAPGPLTVVHFDNHPDWCRTVPARHCGSWVGMALAQPHVRRVVTVGPCSDDLDRPDRKGADLDALSKGRHQVFAWRRSPTVLRRDVADGPGHRCRDGVVTWRNLTEEDFAGFFRRLADALPTRDVWVTVDKDVLAPAEALTNWDQGGMPLALVVEALGVLAERRRIVGADICGEYAPLGHRNPMKLVESILDQPRAPGEAALAKGLRRNAEATRTLVEAFEALR